MTRIKKIFKDNPRCLNSRVNNDGESALHIAVKRKDMQLIEFLLTKDIDVNMKSIRTGYVICDHLNSIMYRRIYLEILRSMRLH